MDRGRLTASFALAACIVLGVGASSASAKTVVGDETGSIVSLTTGETLLIKLKPPNSASSGYHWRVANKPKASVLRLKSNRTSRDGSQQWFTYVARGVGGGTLKLQYVPPSRGGRARKTFNILVLVNEPAPKLGCVQAGSGFASVVAQSGLAQVFTVRRRVAHRYGPGARTTSYDAWYGCEFSQHRAYQLHDSPSPEDIGRDEFANVTVRGTKVGFVVQDGCPFGPDSDGACPDRAVPLVESQDLHTGAVIRSIGIYAGPSPLNTVTGLVMSATGGLAWIEKQYEVEVPARVLRSDDVPPRTSELGFQEPDVLDTGDNGEIDLDSLGFDGTDVTWVRDGKRQRAPLR
jgi:predicted secreted protein